MEGKGRCTWCREGGVRGKEEDMVHLCVNNLDLGYFTCTTQACRPTAYTLIICAIVRPFRG